MSLFFYNSNLLNRLRKTHPVYKMIDEYKQGWEEEVGVCVRLGLVMDSKKNSCTVVSFSVYKNDIPFLDHKTCVTLHVKI